MDSIKLYPTSLFSKLVPSNHLKDYLFRKNIYLEDEDEDQFFNNRSSNNMDSKMFTNKVESILMNIEEANKMFATN